MGDITIGLLHPGEMGAAVGRCLAAAGHQVLWAPAGRSAATGARAAAAGLTACGMAEMEEIAATMAAADLPAGFHQAAAEVYGRLSARAEALG